VVSTDLPMQGALATVSRDTVRSVQLLLERTGGVAGPHTVTLRTYDDSIATTGTWDPFTCRENALTRLDAADEVAVMGTFHTACAQVEVPIMNQSIDGPLTMISGSSTYPGFARPWAAGDFFNSEPFKYYATGVPSFGQVLASDDLQGAAAVEYLRQLRRRRCLVLYDAASAPYGIGIARSFRQAAKRRHITIVGFKAWPRSPHNFKRLFTSARARHPNCVFASGLFTHNGARLVRDKVRYLGPNARVALIGTDGFSGRPALQQLPAASGMYITVAGLPIARIHQRGGTAAAFLDAFTARYGAAPASRYALYGAAAYQLILKALAASDGSQHGVQEQLFGGISVAAADSVLGVPFGITANGSATLREFTINRIGTKSEQPAAYLRV
jgi:branched-chain amino acid transport system substrate-binding protein